MSRGENDVAGVIARPPLIVLGTLVAAFVLDTFFPQGHMARTAGSLRYVASGIALLCAVLLPGAAAHDPFGPTNGDAH